MHCWMVAVARCTIQHSAKQKFEILQQMLMPSRKSGWAFSSVSGVGAFDKKHLFISYKLPY